MCIIGFHVQAHPTYKLIIAANRDEAYARPSKHAHFWDDAPPLFAGRDLKAMGTWMGITKSGRFAALTNYRDPRTEMSNAQTRGKIVSDYLMGNALAKDYLSNLQETRQSYNGFNLLLGSVDELYFYNKVENDIVSLSPGTYTVSNASLNTPWPKVVRLREELRQHCQTHSTIDPGDLLGLLSDDQQAREDLLPDTGVGMELEKQLSPIFIRTPHYGTRASTVMLVTHENEVTFVERTFKEGLQTGRDIVQGFKII